MTLNLWAEITISGFFYLAAIFFLVLGFAGVKEPGFFLQIKDYSSFIIFIAVIVSYVIGILALRIIQMVFSGPIQFIARKLKIKNLLIAGDRENDGAAVEAIIFQFGSERLHQELDYQYNHLVLFASLVVSFPLLAVGLAFWLTVLGFGTWALPTLIIGVLFGFLFFIMANRQRKRFFGFRHEAYLLLKKEMANKK